MGFRAQGVQGLGFRHSAVSWSLNAIGKVRDRLLQSCHICAAKIYDSFKLAGRTVLAPFFLLNAYTTFVLEYADHVQQSQLSGSVAASLAALTGLCFGWMYGPLICGMQWVHKDPRVKGPYYGQIILTVDRRFVCFSTPPCNCM